MTDSHSDISVISLAKFWQNAGLDYIIPNVGTEFPEGFDVFAILKKLINDSDRVVEIGCGYGRLCKAFKADKYIGADLNPKAISFGQEKFPDYFFKLVEPWEELPEADVTLAYSTCFHIPDSDIVRFLNLLCKRSRRVLIAEQMDRRWRRSGNPPMFNREPEEYVAMMRELGYKLISVSKFPYLRYDVPPWHINRDIRQTFHIYEKT